MAWIHPAASGSGAWTLDLGGERLSVAVLACHLLPVAVVCFIAHLPHPSVYCPATTEHLGRHRYPYAKWNCAVADPGGGTGIGLKNLQANKTRCR